MSKNIFFKGGSKWLKADFHLHTEKDSQFDYNGCSFSSDFIDKLNQEDIRIAIITNHNKFDIDEYRELKRLGKSKDIWILPGVELSVNDGENGIHTLIVFDPETWLIEPDNFISNFLASAFENIVNYGNADQRCQYNIENLLDKLDEHSSNGRDSFIIFAHVNQNKGLFNELGGNKIMQLKDNQKFHNFVLGLQKLRRNDYVEKYKQWSGGKIPALVEGSDNKNINDIGNIKKGDVNVATYVKIGDFNFNALKFALRNHEMRIDNKKPAYNKQYIKSISFTGGFLNGKTIDFSQDLNCLIGMRGSGKSSIIEIVRYALELHLTNNSADADYKRNLVDYVMQSGGEVEIIVVGEYGKEYKIKKTLGGISEIKDCKTGEIVSGNLSSIFQLPVYFGQKDLSFKNDDFQVDMLKRLIGGGRLDDVKRRIRATEIEVTNFVLESKKITNITPLIEETKTEIENIENRLKYFREHGADEKLRKQTDFDDDNQILQTIKSKIKQLIDALSDRIYYFWDASSMDVNLSAHNRDIAERLNDIVVKTNHEVSNIKNAIKHLTAILNSFNDIDKILSKQGKVINEEIAVVKRNLNLESVDSETFLKLTRTLTISKAKLNELQKQQSKKATLESQLANKLDTLNNLWEEEYNIIKEKADSINSSDDNINIEVIFKGRKDDFVAKMKSVFQGTYMRESEYKNLAERYSDFMDMYRNKDYLSDIISVEHFETFNNRFEENLDNLIKYRIPDKVVFKYKDKPFEQHSLGQRASAIMLFLLAQDNINVLIVDQPEDDLDNQTIYSEIVKRIIKQKPNMQFIFATHNANIPVLGDSEQVIACDFEKQDKINTITGSIDNDVIHNKIISIMEGGEEAFKKRREVYSSWKLKQV